MFEWLTYEHKTVRAVRGTTNRTLEKLQADGWSVVSEQSGALSKSFKLRRPRSQKSWFQIGAVTAGAVLLASAIGVGALLEHDAPAKTDSQPSSKPRPSPTREVASSLDKKPMAWGNWELVGDISVDEDYYGNFDPMFDVKNTGDEPDEGTFDIIFFKGKQVLGDAWCRTSPGLKIDDSVPPGGTKSVLCESDDRLVRGWTEYRIRDTF